MNLRSQGVPLRSRFIREADDLVHPRSDGADFRDPEAEYPPNDPIEMHRANEQADDFPIDDEPASVPCTTIGTCNGWHRAHESVVTITKLEANVQNLKRELEYERKRLANMMETRDDWKALAEKFAKEVK